jgi:hypothetical protein
MQFFGKFVQKSLVTVDQQSRVLTISRKSNRAWRQIESAFTIYILSFSFLLFFFHFFSFKAFRPDVSVRINDANVASRFATATHLDTIRYFFFYMFARYVESQLLPAVNVYKWTCSEHTIIFIFRLNSLKINLYTVECTSRYDLQSLYMLKKNQM